MKAILILILATSNGIEEKRTPVAIPMKDCTTIGEMSVNQKWVDGKYVTGYVCKEVKG